MVWTLLAGFFAGVIVGVIIMGLMASKRIDEVRDQSYRYWESVAMDMTENWEGSVSLKDWLKKGREND